MASDRHADPITLDHLIDLQKRLAEADEIAENALDGVIYTHRKRLDLEDRLKQAEDTVSRLNGALKDIVLLGGTADGRNTAKLLFQIIAIAERNMENDAPIKPTNSSDYSEG